MHLVWLETLLIGIGTYSMRALSLVLGGRMAWPDWMRGWLGFVTPAVLGALIGPLLLMPSGDTVSILHNPALIAAIPTAIVGWFSRKLLWTVAVGVVSYAVVIHL